MYYKGEKIEPPKTPNTDHFGYGPSIRAELQKRLPRGPGLKVLDVGTGFGKNVEFLHDVLPKNRKIWSIDPSEDVIANVGKMLKEKGIHDVTLAKGIAESHPFGKDSFDIVISEMVMHHMADVEAGIKGLFQSAKPGGLVIVADWAPPAHKLPFSQRHREEDFVPLERAIKVVKELGFSPEVADFRVWYLFTASKPS